MNDLEGKVIVITGASSGLGAAAGQDLANCGARVALLARRKKRLDMLVKECTGKGAQAMALQTDMREYNQVKAAVDAVVAQWGRIDAIINNAGYAVAKPLVEHSVEEIDGQVDVNVKGVLYGCHAVLPHMIKYGRGQIVNIGSVCSLNHYANYTPYCAAKHAITGLSKSLYEEVRGYGIRVNVICPGAVNTEWANVAGAEIPGDRDELLQPEDLAAMIRFCLTLPQRVQVENIVTWPLCDTMK